MTLEEHRENYNPLSKITAKYKGSDKFQVKFGGNDDPNELLEVGKYYEILDIEIYSWHTKIILVDYPVLKFSSASFELSPEAQIVWEFLARIYRKSREF